MMSKFAARRRGFTLIELLIVIVVIAILALIVIPKLMGASRKAKDSTLKANLQILRNAMEQYNADMGFYPPSADMNELYTKPTDAALIASWKGPYLRADGSIVAPGVFIPVNPYQTSTDPTAHWTYDPADTDGKVIVNTEGMPDPLTGEPAYGDL